MSEFYERYNILRKKKGVSDSEVSRATGIARSSFTDWKHGRAQDPSGAAVQKLAQYFGVSADYLLTGRSAPDAPVEISELAGAILKLQDDQRLRTIVTSLVKLDDEALFAVETLISGYEKRCGTKS